MDRKQFLGGFEFHDHRVFDQHVKNVSAIKIDPFVMHRNGYLAPECQSGVGKLVAKAFLIGRFQ